MAGRGNPIKKQFLCGKRCKECDYSYHHNSSYIFCEYILITHKRRECGINEECTKFVPKGTLKRVKNENREDLIEDELNKEDVFESHLYDESRQNIIDRYARKEL